MNSEGTFKLVIVEGPDNCGKSTLINSLKEHLIDKYDDIFILQNPSKDPAMKVSYEIRQMLTRNQKELDDFSRMLLSLTGIHNMYKHIEKLKEQSRSKGRKTLVLLDRNEISTGVYQIGSTSKNHFYKISLTKIFDACGQMLYNDMNAEFIFCMHKFKEKENDTEFDPTKEVGHDAIYNEYNRILKKYFRGCLTLWTPEEYDPEKICQKLEL